jgi:nitric oxide reductase subunit C
MYTANGTSYIPNTYAETWKPEEVDQLLAYLSPLK